MRTIFMHSSTKERFELISDIINILGEKGREVRIDYVSDLLQNKFANKFKNNFDYELYFDSQINILINDYCLIYKNNNLMGLTSKGIEVYDLPNGFLDFIKQIKEEKKKVSLAFSMKIAGIILTIISAFFTGFTLWLSFSKASINSNIIVFGLSCFTLGFVLRGLIMNLIKYLIKMRLK